MNQVTLLGRLVKDPIIRETSTGKRATYFTMAVNKIISKERKQNMEQNGEQTADFIPCKAWGTTGDLIEKYYNKGKQILVEGHLEISNYKDNDGTWINRTNVIVYRSYFLDNKKEPDYGNEPGQDQPPEYFEERDDFIPF